MIQLVKMNLMKNCMDFYPVTSPTTTRMFSVSQYQKYKAKLEGDLTNLAAKVQDIQSLHYISTLGINLPLLSVGGLCNVIQTRFSMQELHSLPVKNSLMQIAQRRSMNLPVMKEGNHSIVQLLLVQERTLYQFALWLTHVKHKSSAESVLVSVQMSLHDTSLPFPIKMHQTLYGTSLPSNSTCFLPPTLNPALGCREIVPYNDGNETISIPSPLYIQVWSMCQRSKKQM